MVGDADGGGVGGTGKTRRWAKVSLPLLLLALIGSVARLRVCLLARSPAALLHS